MNFLTKKNQMAKKGTNTMKEQEPELITLVQAEEQLAEITAKKNELTTRSEVLHRSIGSAQHQSARRYLSGDMSGLEDGARLRAELDTIGSALDLLNVDLKQAESELLAAKARDFRDQAQQKTAELEKLNAKTAAVLAELSELEGMTYTHSILSSQPLSGAWLQWGTIKPPLEYQGLSELQLTYPAPERKMEVPLSRRLRMQIAELEKQAAEIENQLRQSQPAPAAA